MSYTNKNTARLRANSSPAAESGDRPARERRGRKLWADAALELIAERVVEVEGGGERVDEALVLVGRAPLKGAARAAVAEEERRRREERDEL